MNIKLFNDKYKTISKFYSYSTDKSIEDSFVHQIYELNKDDISSFQYNGKIIYNKHYNGLKLYARNGYDFNLIKMGSLIAFNKLKL